MQSKLSKSELVVKKICDTRWSARHDAIRALVLAPRSIKETLDEIALDEIKHCPLEMMQHPYQKNSNLWNLR